LASEAREIGSNAPPGQGTGREQHCPCRENGRKQRLSQISPPHDPTKLRHFSLRPESSPLALNPHNQDKLAEYPIFAKHYIFTGWRADLCLHHRSAIPVVTVAPPRNVVLMGEVNVAKSSSSRSAQNKKKATPKTAAPRGTSSKASGSVATATPVIDRRAKSEKEERRGTDRRKKSEPVAVERRQLERREKVNRRRQIDPTTCEREYTDAEIEFMNALEVYKRKNGRMFPTCSEILEVILSLGYQKPNAAQAQPVGENAAPMAHEVPAIPPGPNEPGEACPTIEA